MVENFLELGGGFLALPSRQIRFAANVGGIEAGDAGDEADLPATKRSRSVSSALYTTPMPPPPSFLDDAVVRDGLIEHGPRG
jgi:hypothetical protein